jgi:hypothetical protein
VRHCPRVLRCLIALTAAAALPFPAALPADAPKRSPFEGVAALEKPITLSETKIPLGELVHKVAAETGVKLSATREVADEPVAVVVKELPARELLEQLADLLDYMWSKRGKDGEERYEIWQDLAAKQREEALRQAGVVAAWKQLQAEVGRVTAMARLPLPQIEAIQLASERRLDEAAKLPRDQPQAFVRSPEVQEWNDRLRIANIVSIPIPRAVAAALGRLSPRQWDTLRRDRRLVLSTQPQPGELPLPEDAARMFRATSLPRRSPEGIGGSPDAVAAQREADRAWQANWEAATGYRMQIVLDDRNLVAGRTVDLQATVSPLPAGAPVPDVPLGWQMGVHLVGVAAAGDPEPTPEHLAEWVKDPILGRAAPVKPRPAAAERSGPTTAGNRRSILDLLPDLAQSYGAGFITDAYWHTPVVYGQTLEPEPAPLYRNLALLAGHAYRWDRRGSLVRLRSRAWYLERPREVPLRLVRRWAAIGERLGALPLDEYVAMATELRDPQLQDLSVLVRRGALPVGLNDIESVYRARHGLRLYAALTPPQLDALWAGQPLSLTATSGPQRSQFEAALAGIVGDRDPGADPPFTMAGWQDPRFTVTRFRMSRVGEQDAAVQFFGQRETGPPTPPIVPPPTPTEPARPAPPSTPGTERAPLRRSPLADLRPGDRQSYTQVRLSFTEAAEMRSHDLLTIAVAR